MLFEDLSAIQSVMVELEGVAMSQEGFGARWRDHGAMPEPLGLESADPSCIDCGIQEDPVVCLVAYAWL